MQLPKPIIEDGKTVYNYDEIATYARCSGITMVEAFDRLGIELHNTKRKGGTMSDERKQTLGEYRVGITFNPGGNPLVDELKAMAAAFIDKVATITGPPDAPHDSEIGRLKSLAQTNMEDAAMWAVKAATKPAKVS